MESMSVSPGPLQEGPALDEYDNFDAISRMVKRNESKDNKLEMLVQLNINERLKTLTQNVTPEVSAIHIFPLICSSRPCPS